MHLDALVPGQSYFYNGTTPGASATLGQPFGACEVIVSTGPTSALKVNVAATTATVPANSDTYLDVTTAGTYTQTSVTIGAAPPATAAGALRVWKITSGASAVVSVTLLAPTQPLNVSQVQNAATVAGTIPALSAGAPNGVATLDAQGRGVQPAGPDTTEAATNDTLGATSTGTTNLNRMRYALAQIVGAPQATMASVLASLRQAVQLSPSGPQVGAINIAGVATVGGLSVGGHVANTGATPTVARAAGATWITGTPAVAGTDCRCTFNFSSPAFSAGDQVVVTFATPYAVPPQVQPTCQGNYADLYISALSTTGFTLAFSGGGVAGPGLMTVVCSIEQ